MKTLTTFFAHLTSRMENYQIALACLYIVALILFVAILIAMAIRSIKATMAERKAAKIPAVKASENYQSDFELATA
jgi:ABC-type phosphate transport system permease subunit